MRRSTEGQLMSLISLGDGSTLSLDFTTGVLDPRLTFTRTTNATFINSQGLVEWANSNMYWNTAFEGLSGSNPSLTSSGWGYALSTGGTAVFNGDGSVTVTTTAAERRAIFRSSGFSGGGLRVVASVDVTIASGSLQASQVIVTGTPTNAQHYVNGVAWNSLHPLWNGGILPVGTQFNIAYATDSLTSGTTSMYFGVGCSSVIAGSATFSNPRWTMWKGSGTVPYYPNTSATNNSTANYFKSNDYQAPRFDYDPSTLQPRGLLIEGSANNLCEQGQYCWGTGATKIWVRSAGINVNSVNGSGGANIIARIDGPDGGSLTGTSVVKDAGLSFVRFNVDVTVAASTTYTFSAYVRAPSGGNPYMRLAAFNGGTWLATTGGTTASGITITDTANNGSRFNGVSSTAWVRVWVTFTTQAGQTAATIAFYPDTDTTNTATMYVWGGQVEAGSGPSSVILTGASTATRNADSCVMTGTNFSSWFAGATEGVLYTQFEKPRSQAGTIGHDHAAVGSQYGSGTGFTVYAAASVYYPTTLLWPTGGALFPGGIASAIPNVSKQAGKWFGGNDATNYANGVQGTTSAGTGTLAPNMLTIGANSASGTAATRDWLNACVRIVKFWPVALPDSQIIALTTP
jgi:hypothetical protein